MKKLSFLLATLLIGGMMFSGCTKTPDPEPDPEPDPTPSTYTVRYEVFKKNASHTLPDCFKLDVTYTGADGQMVTENGVTVPWVKVIEVNAPFNAKMVGTFVFVEDELPESFYYGRIKDISIYQGNSLISGSGGVIPSGSFIGTTKEKFLKILEKDPDYVKFTIEKDIK